MNTEKVFFAFFIVFAFTLNFGFFIGGMDNPDHHSVYELFAAIVVNLIATVLKLGDRTHLGAVYLATSLVADLQLLAAASVWGLTEIVFEAGQGSAMPTIISLSGGAMVANVISAILLIAETISVRR